MHTEKNYFYANGSRIVGTQQIQGRLWGKKAEDWSEIQEKTAIEGYRFVLQKLGSLHAKKLLDAGCGSGMFCGMAAKAGAEVIGLDASPNLIRIATQKAPSANFTIGEIEDLPFPDASFDVVSGFNAFQYAGNIQNALTEGNRVLKTNGKLVVMIWGDKEECEASSYIDAIASCAPPPIPGAPGPFALSEKNKLEVLLENAGFKIENITDVPSVWKYANKEIAIRGLLSSGPAAKAIEHSGYVKVEQAALQSMIPFINIKGQIIYRNKFRVAIGTKK